MKLELIRKLCAEATAGEWQIEQVQTFPAGIKVTTKHGESIAETKKPQDALFIAAARAALPYMVDEIERLRLKLDLAEASYAENTHKLQVMAVEALELVRTNQNLLRAADLRALSSLRSGMEFLAKF